MTEHKRCIRAMRHAVEREYKLMVRGKCMSAAIQYQKAVREWKEAKELKCLS